MRNSSIQMSIDDQALLYGAARGMVDSLGDTGHSSFLDPDEATAFRAALCWRA